MSHTARSKCVSTKIILQQFSTFMFDCCFNNHNRVQTP
uniref:Uncharacterized protein n=1 Tax=Rhizophora mucronata TaxID=61149 RepID=A0A2P2PSA4_RHIMU